MSQRKCHFEVTAQRQCERGHRQRRKRNIQRGDYSGVPKAKSSLLLRNEKPDKVRGQDTHIAVRDKARTQTSTGTWGQAMGSQGTAANESAVSCGRARGTSTAAIRASQVTAKDQRHKASREILESFEPWKIIHSCQKPECWKKRRAFRVGSLTPQYEPQNSIAPPRSWWGF